MTGFSNQRPLTSHYPRVSQLQRPTQDYTRRLEEARQRRRRRRRRAEEKLAELTRETERRMQFIMRNIRVIDALEQLGSVLQEERYLSEQLKEQEAADRQRKELQKRSEFITNKVRSLTADMLEVKRRLEEVEACNMAAEASLHGPTSESNSNQSNVE